MGCNAPHGAALSVSLNNYAARKLLQATKRQTEQSRLKQ